MGGLIQAAQRQMIAIVSELSGAAAVDLRLGVVEYRDHPPQDSLVYRLYALTGDLAGAQQTIMGLAAEGGGDPPEAVLDGVVAAARELAWRPPARRLAVLFGDAPPHGSGPRFGDQLPDGCPCGETIESAAGVAETSRVTLYAVGLTPHVTDSFGALSHLTGGRYFGAVFLGPRGEGGDRPPLQHPGGRVRRPGARPLRRLTTDERDEWLRRPGAARRPRGPGPWCAAPRPGQPVLPRGPPRRPGRAVVEWLTDGRRVDFELTWHDARVTLFER